MVKTSLNLPYLVLTGVIVIAIVVVTTVIYPMFNDISSTRQKITETNNKTVEQKKYLQTIDQKIATLNSQSIHEKRLSIILPSDNVDKDMLRVIAQISAATGVVVNSITNSTTNLQAAAKANINHNNTGGLPANILPVGFALKMSGSYSQIRDFFNQLERAIQLTDVASISLSKDANAPETLSGDVMLRSYTLINTKE